MSIQHCFMNNAIGTRISPVSERSMIGGTQIVTATLGDNSVKSATTQACASCLVKPAVGNTGVVYVTINKADRAGTVNIPTADSFPLDASSTSIPVGNLNLLSFFFTKNADTVRILWRDEITPDQEVAVTIL
jgi:hypothetical protein